MSDVNTNAAAVDSRRSRRAAEWLSNGDLAAARVREDVALAATMAGDHGIALEQLELLLTMPAHFSLHTLRLDPRWDPLRSEMRYKALMAQGLGPSQVNSQEAAQRYR